MEILVGLGAIVVLYLLMKLLSFPIKAITGLVVNGVIGLLMLWVVNLFGSAIGLSVDINIISALVAGFFSIPGVLVLILLNL
ncbi:MAG: pro-sigmaK processing inhibitor BofA [Tissierellia bacterium]|nr:pro-sigmaK processing inhibitor BofA [Tissierellia bacterium]